MFYHKLEIEKGRLRRLTKLQSIHDDPERDILKIAVLAIPGEENRRVRENFHHIPFDDADLLFLSGNRDMITLQPIFQRNGWQHWIQSRPGIGQDLMVIASRSPFGTSGETAARQQDNGVKIYLPGHDMRISGIDFPKSRDTRDSELLFRKILKIFELQKDNPAVIMGNLKIPAANLDTILDYKHYLQEIASLGWSNAWRTLHPMTYERIWYGSMGQPIHLNLVFLSPLLRESLIAAYHCQPFSDNRQTAKDFRILLVELA